MVLLLRITTLPARPEAMIVTTQPMRALSWSESICVRSGDAGCSEYRSTAVVRPQHGPEVRRREGVHFALGLVPVGYADSAVCYIENGGAVGRSRRHFRSTVRYSGSGLRARRFFETCFVLPQPDGKQRTYGSLVETHPVKDRRYTTALKLIPRAGDLNGADDVFDRVPAAVIDDNAAICRTPSSADGNNNNNNNNNLIVSRDKGKAPKGLDDCRGTTTFRSQLVVNGGPRE